MDSAHKSSLLPTDQTIGRAIDLYYMYAHRQPLWLFSRDALTVSSNEVLILVVLSIAAQHPSWSSSHEVLLSAETYSDAARSLIMSRIASASVDLYVLQALCLLAYSNKLGKSHYLKEDCVADLA